MPELPEVETSRRHLERLLKGKRITQVVPDLDDHIVFDQASPEEFREAVEGARVKGTGRKGKYFWLELDRRPWPVFHLGMTGHLEVRKKSGKFHKVWGDEEKRKGPKRAPRDPLKTLEAKLLPFCRLRLIAADGTEVAITDPRRFGRIRLAQDPLTEPPISKLGNDPLIDFPSARRLAELLGKRRAPIKAVLLDQSLFAGVGNWIADEVLYQARLSPHRLGSQLSAAEAARLRTKLLAIVKKAVALHADYSRYPKTWLFHDRWGKKSGAKTSRQHAIVHDTVGGRTTAWVPSIQV